MPNHSKKVSVQSVKSHSTKKGSGWRKGGMSRGKLSTGLTRKKG